MTHVTIILLESCSCTVSITEQLNAVIKSRLRVVWHFLMIREIWLVSFPSRLISKKKGKEKVDNIKNRITIRAILLNTLTSTDCTSRHFLLLQFLSFQHVIFNVSCSRKLCDKCVWSVYFVVESRKPSQKLEVFTIYVIRNKISRLVTKLRPLVENFTKISGRSIAITKLVWIEQFPTNEDTL